MAIARLQIESGNDRGKEVDLARIMVIGRSAGCDLVLNDESCSRMHVRLRPEGDACRIEDLGSTNGTYVNGERLSTGHLKDGDLFTVGGTSIRLRWPSFDAGATVVLEAAAREQARVADRIELADGDASAHDGAAAPLLHAMIGLLQSTRGVPDTHAVARALCDQSRQLLAADRTAVLLLRSGGEGAVAVSSSNLRLDAGRPWVAEALRAYESTMLPRSTETARLLDGAVDGLISTELPDFARS